MDRSILSPLLELNLEIEFDVPMKDYTSFKIGGPAECMVTPFDEEALAAVLRFAKENGIDTFILGCGSNILVSDSGIKGFVVNMSEGFSELRLDGEDTIYASAGVKLSRISVFAMNCSLSGLEFASGIPGSLGGAVYMNAGAYGGEMKDVVIRTRCMGRDGKIMEIEGVQHGFGYRKSVFSDSDIVLLGSFIKLKPGDRFSIAKAMKENKDKRVQKQPLSYPSAGSAFKRPEGDFAGRLIEASGLKGHKVGGAQVSEKHAGFIINYNGASARDVYELILHIKEEVKNKQGVELECEIKLIGDF